MLMKRQERLVPEVFFGILEEERGFTYPSCALDADKAIVPINRP